MNDIKPIGPFAELSEGEREGSLKDTLAARPAGQPLRVFGYGSLMWDPCFSYSASTPADLPGYARRMCVWTALARGTPEQPGLGLGLIASSNTTCQGVVFDLDEGTLDRDLPVLWQREMHTSIYRPVWTAVDTSEGTVQALTFVVDQTNPQYAGDIGDQTAARYIAAASGKFGTNRDYLYNCVKRLAELGLQDQDLPALQSEVEKL